MDNIVYSVGDNLPGIKKAWLADVDLVDTLPAPDQLLIEDDITFLSGGGWHLITFVNQSGVLSTSGSDNRHGPIFTASLSGTIAKDSPTIAQSLEYIKNRKLIILIQDKNDQYRLVGNKNYYLQESNNFDSGSTGTESNRNSITFSGYIRESPPFYTGAISTASAINLQNQPVGDNVPGVRAVYFTDANNVYSISTDTDYVVSDDITLIGEAVWYRLGFIHQSGRLQINKRSNNIGNSFSVNVTGNIAKPTQPKMYSLNSLKNRNFVLFVIDRNGLIKIIGDEENYLRLTFGENSGSLASGSNQIAIQFTGNILKKPRFYNGTIATEPPDPSERGIGFDIIGVTNIVG